MPVSAKILREPGKRILLKSRRKSRIVPSFGRVAQLVRAQHSHCWGHRFESCRDHHFCSRNIFLRFRRRIFKKYFFPVGDFFFAAGTRISRNSNAIAPHEKPRRTFRHPAQSRVNQDDEEKNLKRKNCRRRRQNAQPGGKIYFSDVPAENECGGNAPRATDEAHFLVRRNFPAPAIVVAQKFREKPPKLSLNDSENQCESRKSEKQKRDRDASGGSVDDRAHRLHGNAAHVRVRFGINRLFALAFKTNGNRTKNFCAAGGNESNVRP